VFNRSIASFVEGLLFFFKLVAKLCASIIETVFLGLKELTRTLLFHFWDVLFTPIFTIEIRKMRYVCYF